MEHLSQVSSRSGVDRIWNRAEKIQVNRKAMTEMERQSGAAGEIKAIKGGQSSELLQSGASDGSKRLPMRGNQ